MNLTMALQRLYISEKCTVQEPPGVFMCYDKNVKIVHHVNCENTYLSVIILHDAITAAGN